MYKVDAMTIKAKKQMSANYWISLPRILIRGLPVIPVISHYVGLALIWASKRFL